MSCTARGRGSIRMLGTLAGVGWVSVPSFRHVAWPFAIQMVTPFLVAAVAATVKTAGLLALCQKMNDTTRNAPDVEVLRRGMIAGLAAEAQPQLNDPPWAGCSPSPPRPLSWERSWHSPRARSLLAGSARRGNRPPGCHKPPSRHDATARGGAVPARAT